MANKTIIEVPQSINQIMEGLKETYQEVTGYKISRQETVRMVFAFGEKNISTKGNEAKDFVAKYATKKK